MTSTPVHPAESDDPATPPTPAAADEWTRIWATTAADLLDQQQSEDTP